MVIQDQPSTLWRLRKDDKWVECVARLVPTGVEIEIVKDGTRLYSRIFASGEEARTWAETEKQAHGSH